MQLLDCSVDWLTARLTPEQDWNVERVVRTLDPRAGQLYRRCVEQQEVIQQGCWEVMRLELELEEAQLSYQLLAEQLDALQLAVAQLQMDQLRPR